MKREGDLDKRKAVRYKLCLPVLFKWIDADGCPVQEGGFTRDISTAGLYVNCPNLPPVPRDLALEILLPLSEILKLQATVEIVRVGTHPEARGFATVGGLSTDRSQHQ